MDDELNRYVTNVIGKLDDGKSARDEVDVVKVLIQRGKSLGAYEEQLKQLIQWKLKLLNGQKM